MEQNSALNKERHLTEFETQIINTVKTRENFTKIVVSHTISVYLFSLQENDKGQKEALGWKNIINLLWF